MNAVIPCRVEEYDDPEAVCSMLVDGYELPRVSFPSWVLRHHGLREGDHFEWTLHGDGGDVFIPDVKPVPPPSFEMSEEEKAELDRLYEDSQQDLWEDGPWPEYTGDGR